MKCYVGPWTWTDSLNLSKGKWTSVWRIKCKKSLQGRFTDNRWKSEVKDLMGVHGVRWGRGSTEREYNYTFFSGNGNDNHELSIRFFVHKTIIIAVKRAEFICDTESYIILRGHS
jgi:hypothetical protein